MKQAPKQGRVDMMGVVSLDTATIRHNTTMEHLPVAVA